MNLHTILQNASKCAEKGTIRPHLLKTSNDKRSFDVMVGGDDIFRRVAREVSNAEREVLIQTFTWDARIPAVEWLKNALIARKKTSRLKVYIQIDERGFVANLAFNGTIGKKWPVSAKSIGLDVDRDDTEIYVSTYYHNSLGSNHGKTVVIDGTTLIITGANFQASNFHHVPAHDSGYIFKGGVALAARDDFVYMWSRRYSAGDTPDLNNLDNNQYLDNYLDNEMSSEYSDDTTEDDTTEDDLSVLLVTRCPQAVVSYNPIDNPQNIIIDHILKGAERVVRIGTPNLNCGFVVDNLINFVNRGGYLELMLGNGFNEKRENPIVGGINQNTVNYIMSKINKEYKDNVAIRWFSLDGVAPVVGNVAGASHLKFMSIDDRLLFCGNANLDVTSLCHAHEVNFLLVDPDLCRYATDMVFKQYFERAIDAHPSMSKISRFKDKIGIRGVQGFLAQRYKSEILEIFDECGGFKTYRLSRPNDFNFLPGQYINVRSGKKMSSVIKAPLVVAIASGVHDSYLEITCRSSALGWSPNHAVFKSVGDTVEIEGPLGTGFPCDMIDLNKGYLLLVGGGSGITVLRSLYRSLIKDDQDSVGEEDDSRRNSNLRIIYSNKTYETLIYKDLIRKWIKEDHVVSLTQERRFKKKRFHNLRVTDLIEDELSEETYVFACGPTVLVKDSLDKLKGKDLNTKQFYGSLPYDALNGGPVFRGDHVVFK